MSRGVRKGGPRSPPPPPSTRASPPDLVSCDGVK